jgi:membrane protein implicated in regulation of membrane protease activity
VLAAAVAWWDLPRTAAALLFGVWVLKDLALFPVLRIAYEPRSGGGFAELAGARAIAREPLAPLGYVRIGGELWRAEAASGFVPRGAPVRVVAVRGLTLVVEPEAGEGEQPGEQST